MDVSFIKEQLALEINHFQQKRKSMAGYERDQYMQSKEYLSGIRVIRIMRQLMVDARN